jgi:hypothetical protein
MKVQKIGEVIEVAYRFRNSSESIVTEIKGAQSLHAANLFGNLGELVFRKHQALEIGLLPNIVWHMPEALLAKTQSAARAG